MMSSRTALATAAAAVLTITTGSLAVAANLGMLADDEPIGQLTPVTEPTAADAGVAEPSETPTIYVDEQGNVLSIVPGQAQPPDVVPANPDATTPSRDDQLSDADMADEEQYAEDHGDDEDDQEGEDHGHDQNDEEHEGRDDDD